MRIVRRNKQRMFYSLIDGESPVYETDDDGNVRYIEIDGEQVPIEVGTTKAVYTAPVEFYANISSNLNEMHLKAYGVDQSSIYSEIIVEKGYLPLVIGMLIWRTSEIEWDDEVNKLPKQDSADYVVCGIMDEGLTTDSLLLQRISNGRFSKMDFLEDGEGNKLLSGRNKFLSE